MKGIAGFLVLTSIASACDGGQAPEKPPQPEPPKTTKAATKSAELAKAEPMPMAIEPKANLALAAPAPELAPAAGKTSVAKPKQVPAAAKDKDKAKAKAKPGGKLVSGSAVAGEGFKVQMQTQSPQVVGKQGNLLITLTADAPYKCNEKYPYKFKFAPIDGVAFPNEVVRGMSVGHTTSTMSVPFSPQQSGKQSVSGDLSFSVCTDDKCLVEKQRLSVTFDVDAS